MLVSRLYIANGSAVQTGFIDEADMDLSKNGKDNYSIVVGIPSYNEAKNITHVAEVVGEGLEQYFHERKSIIVNVDNNSPDNTREAFLDARTNVEKKYVSTGEGVLGKGNNLSNLFNFASRADAEIIIMVDADHRSITKEWIEHLGRPVIKGYDYVTPVYSRHQFDATITNHICYPVVFGMLSTDIRQPIGGDFAFSPRLMDYWLKRSWTDHVRQYGIDIFMTLHAIFGGFKICQSVLGTKVHKVSSPKLGNMFEQVVETLLTMLAHNKNVWMSRGGDKAVVPDTFGRDDMPEPQEVYFDIHALKGICQKEYRMRLKDIKELLDPYAYSRVCEMFDRDVFDMDTLLWAQIFYSLVYRYNIAASNEERRKIINTLKPLYFARCLSFNYETWKHNIKYAEIEIRKQALGFASQKYYLSGLYGK